MSSSSPASSTPCNKDDAAAALAQAHYRVEPDLASVFRIRGSADVEERTEEPIKLLEINKTTIPSGVMPLQFAADPARGIPYSSIIVEVTPEEFEQIRSGRITLPDGWTLAERLQRNGTRNSGRKTRR